MESVLALFLGEVPLLITLKSPHQISLVLSCFGCAWNDFLALLLLEH